MGGAKTSRPLVFKKMDILYCLLALAGFVGLWFFNDKVIVEKFIEPTRQYPYTKFEKCDPPLGTANGIGFTLYGTGRYDYNTGSTAHYLFFCFFIPLLPLGCYRAQMVGSKGRSTQYRIFGHEKWRFWEVISIYLSTYSWIGGIISIIALICTFFD